MAPMPASALEPPEDFGIKLVPSFAAEKLASHCDYLGEVASRSAWGGLVAGSLGQKGVLKRLYKKAHRLGATHLVLIEASETSYDNLTAGSGHAFYCEQGTNVAGVSAAEAGELKQSQERAEDNAQTKVSLRAVKAESRGSCKFIKSITKGSGGSEDPSKYAEKSLEAALDEAASSGADSYEVINFDTTESGATVTIEALYCNGEA